jgi:hypothetical protein
MVLIPSFRGFNPSRELKLASMPPLAIMLLHNASKWTCAFTSLGGGKPVISYLLSPFFSVSHTTFTGNTYHLCSQGEIIMLLLSL